MRPLPAARTILISVAVAASAAACAATPTSPSPGPSAVPPTAAPTTAGPANFADWTARQGFGGSSGLANVKKLADWLVGHRAEVRLFDLDSDSGDVIGLASWLDAHPPTACWTDYHVRVRALLQKIVAGYTDARAAVADGEPIPEGVAEGIQAEAVAAFSMPAPASCP